MSFKDHLKELRTRIIRSLLGVLAGFLACYAFSDKILAWLLIPLQTALDSLVAQGRLPAVDAPLHFGDPIEPFFAYLKLSLVAGIFVGAPVVLYQMWAFVAPGLYAREKRFILPLVLLGTLFFVGGGAFCYYLVLPYGFEFLIGYGLGEPGAPVVISPLLMMEDYLERAEQMLLAFGLVFELPLVVGALSWMGLVTPKTLWKWNRHAIVAIFIVAAVLTPPDPISLLVMAGPMVVLYELAILVSVVIHRKRQSPPASTE